MLGIGGTISTVAGKFTKANQLPQQPFKITEIDLLSNKQVTDDSLSRLTGLEKLTRLHLSGTQVSEAGVAALAKDLAK